MLARIDTVSAAVAPRHLSPAGKLAQIILREDLLESRRRVVKTHKGFRTQWFAELIVGNHFRPTSIRYE